MPLARIETAKFSTWFLGAAHHDRRRLRNTQSILTACSRLQRLQPVAAGRQARYAFEQPPEV
ncbi:hypothetical protein HYPDE_31898 [Hyphomicrobium denitrificans 1NES1]|uniref:Uncharacterized protein n=1 Tax=Hyphomicrobium denitrificans 1NES1 TaxID=670307 RepID=N0B3H9_9HYPH|nr:hypothetical protein HYPDE_31898 [Hyphomicrobium denitrificans 1NES1]